MPGRHVWFVLAGLFARSAAKLFSFERSSGRSPLQGRSTIRSQFRGASKIGDATAGSSCPYNSNPIGGNGAVLQFEANLQPATTITFATAGWNSPYNSKPIGALGRFTVRSQITSDDDHRRYSRLELSVQFEAKSPGSPASVRRAAPPAKSSDQDWLLCSQGRLPILFIVPIPAMKAYMNSAEKGDRRNRLSYLGAEIRKA